MTNVIMSKKDQIKQALTRGVENIYPSKGTLEKVLNSSKKLTIYNGIDPTGKLHLGHGVVLNKLKQFQELGHQIIILIGDFTAQVGDPTDKTSARKSLSKKEVLKNAKDYKKLINKVLDPEKTKFEYNSKWLEKMDFAEVIKLSSQFSVQRLLERDMFQKRIKEGKIIHLHEFIYPALVSYDCVALDVDMEVGGNDQTFNMLSGRTLMKKIKGKEKFVLTTRLLVDTTGKKMGKTEGNMVNMDDSPEEMYGKVMSWTDQMIIPAFEIATNVPMAEVEQIVRDLGKAENPKKFKMLLAYKIVEMYHGKKAAISAEENFKQIFGEKLNPDNIKVFKTKKRNIIDVLVATNLAVSKSEARRLVVQGGVRVDTKKILDENFKIGKIDKDGVVIQRGKRHFAKIVN